MRFLKKRKLYRKSRRSTLRFKRRKYRRSLKSFKRKINQVSEKKQIYFACPNSADTFANTLSTNDTVNVGTGGIFSWLFNNLTQGTSNHNRIGDKIFIKKLIIKGQFTNLLITPAVTNGISSIVGMWLIRELHQGSTLLTTRTDIVGSTPFATIPQFSEVGYFVVKKKHGFLQNVSNSQNNTMPLMGTSMGYDWHFKIKIKINKTMHWQTDSAWRISDGKGDYVPIPWIDSNYYNKTGTGPVNNINCRVTYIDV